MIITTTNIIIIVFLCLLLLLLLVLVLLLLLELVVLLLLPLVFTLVELVVDFFKNSWAPNALVLCLGVLGCALGLMVSPFVSGSGPLSFRAGDGCLIVHIIRRLRKPCSLELGRIVFFPNFFGDDCQETKGRQLGCRCRRSLSPNASSRKVWHSWAWALLLCCPGCVRLCSSFWTSRSSLDGAQRRICQTISETPQALLWLPHVALDTPLPNTDTQHNISLCGNPWDSMDPMGIHGFHRHPWNPCFLMGIMGLMKSVVTMAFLLKFPHVWFSSHAVRSSTNGSIKLNTNA